MSNRHRELLEKRIQEEAAERATSHLENRNDSQHELGFARGYWNALRDVLTWSTEIERDLNS